MVSPKFKQNQILMRQEQGATLSQGKGGSGEWVWELEQQWEDGVQARGLTASSHRARGWLDRVFRIY